MQPRAARRALTRDKPALLACRASSLPPPALLHPVLSAATLRPHALCARAAQRGHYAAAVHGGERAAAADDAYLDECGREQYYFTYRNHHINQLTWAAMFDGRYALASDSARRLVDETPAAIFASEI